MYLKMAKRFLMETDKRLAWKFFRIMGLGGVRSVMKYRSRLKRGEFFPPFLYVSIINSCNLRGQGCWVDVAAKQERIDIEAMSKLVTEAQAMGNVFFGIVGGEPFMHPEILEIFRRHPKCYFQVFTNGHFITSEVAGELRRLGNVTPLISVEGTEIISDQRRGRDLLDESALALERNAHLIRGGGKVPPCPSRDNHVAEGIELRVVAAPHVDDLRIAGAQQHHRRPQRPSASKAGGDELPVFLKLFFYLGDEIRIGYEARPH